MTEPKTNINELFTVCVMATAADAPRAKELSLDWVKAVKPSTDETVGEMLKTPLSPTGLAPATDFLCCMTLTKKAIDNMLSHREANQSPVVIEIVGPQDDTLEAQFANRDRYLASIGRKVID
jgi:hypothetical protein